MTKHEIVSFLNAGRELGIKRLLLVTWDEETELEGGLKVVPVWKLLAGYELVFR